MGGKGWTVLVGGEERERLRSSRQEDDRKWLILCPRYQSLLQKACLNKKKCGATNLAQHKNRKGSHPLNNYHELNILPRSSVVLAA
jgi:hypothetical protein